MERLLTRRNVIGGLFLAAVASLVPRGHHHKAGLFPSLSTYPGPNLYPGV